MNDMATNVLATDPFVRGYLEAAFWITQDLDNAEDEDKSLEQRGLSPWDMTEEALKAAEEDCNVFRRIAGSAYLTASEKRLPGHLGHDFWLTRNGHGTGFWDREELTDWEGDRLTQIATVFGEVLLYRGDDGKVHYE